MTGIGKRTAYRSTPGSRWATKAGRGTSALLVALCLLSWPLSTFARDAQQDRPAFQATLAGLAQDRTVDATLGRTPKVRTDRMPALSMNKKILQEGGGSIYIYKQGVGAVYVQMGAVRERPDLRTFGWRAIDLGFSFQKLDGSFEAKYPILSTAFLVDAAARALVMERELGLSSDGERLVPKVELSAKWLAARDERIDRESRRLAKFTHSDWLMASALVLSAEVVHDKVLAGRANDYIEKALKAQRPDGVNPENGGFDVGYQSVGLRRATTVLTVTKDPALRARIARHIAMGLDWLATKVGPDGTVDSEGSTRVGVEQALYGGKKRVPYKSVAEAFATGGYALGRPDFVAVAQRIMDGEAFRDYTRPRKAAPANDNASPN